MVNQKRARELVYEAAAATGQGAGACYMAFAEKLVELVARECLQIVEERIHRPCKYEFRTDEQYAADERTEEIHSEIKEHFGIE